MKTLALSASLAILIAVSGCMSLPCYQVEYLLERWPDDVPLQHHHEYHCERDYGWAATAAGVSRF